MVVDANKAMTYITNLERATLDAAERIAAMIDESDKHLTLACRGNKPLQTCNPAAAT